MKSIWKQYLKVQDVQKILLPKGAKILCVQVQKGIPCLWFINQDLSNDNQEERIIILLYLNLLPWGATLPKLGLLRPLLPYIGLLIPVLNI